MRHVDDAHDAEDQRQARAPTAPGRPRSPCLRAGRAADGGRRPSAIRHRREEGRDCAAMRAGDLPLLRAPSWCSRPRRLVEAFLDRGAVDHAHLPPFTWVMFWWPKTWWILPLNILSPCGCSLPSGHGGDRLHRLDQLRRSAGPCVARGLHRLLDDVERLPAAETCANRSRRRRRRLTRAPLSSTPTVAR